MIPMTSIDVPQIEGVGIELLPPHTLKLKGTITKKEPGQELTGFFRSIHQDVLARALPEFRVDVSELTFVNSSSIRLFIDWAVWVKNETKHPYVLRFQTSRKVTWQQTAFSALASLMKDVVSIESS
jgi:hypothetical protein